MSHYSKRFKNINKEYVVVYCILVWAGISISTLTFKTGFYKGTRPFPTGVVEYLNNGGVAENHKDFKELRYRDCLTNFSCNGKNGKPDGSITHSFQLKSSYEGNLIPYTNYTYDFKVRQYIKLDLKRLRLRLILLNGIYILGFANMIVSRSSEQIILHVHKEALISEASVCHVVSLPKVFFFFACMSS